MLCVAACIPRAARQLAHQSGLIPWLAAAADSALRALLRPAEAQRLGGGGAAAADASAAALQALRRLLQLRAVMRGSGGAAAAQQMVAAALQLAAAALAAVGSSAALAGRGDSLAAVPLRHLLAFLREVEQLAGGSGAAVPVQLREAAGSLAALSAVNEKLGARFDTDQALE
jgi:hypothetical protein